MQFFSENGLFDDFFTYYLFKAFFKMKKQLTSLAAILFLLNACQQPALDAGAKPFDEAAEKAAIMKTIEEETACYFNLDYDCWKEMYAQTEYAFQAWNNSDGTFDARVGWKEIDEKVGQDIKNSPKPEDGGVSSKVERRNMIVKFFNENVAYLIFDQYWLDRNLNKYYYSKDTRIMEKINGKWRIVNVSAFSDHKNLIPVDSLK